MIIIPKLTRRQWELVLEAMGEAPRGWLHPSTRRSLENAEAEIAASIEAAEPKRRPA